jgi:hypothetical protein
MSVRARMRRPFRIPFRGSTDASDETRSTDPATAPLVGLTVYALDSLAFGHVPLSAARVTDLMNEHEDFEFVDAHLESLEDLHALALRTVVIARGEILAVGVSGPRGDARRRTRTLPIPIELRVGPYDIRGNIHVVPGADPLASFRRRGAMVPLTETTIEWDAPDGRKLARWGTMLVNRLLVEWIAPSKRDIRPRDLQLVPEFETSGYATEYHL